MRSTSTRYERQAPSTDLVYFNRTPMGAIEGIRELGWRYANTKATCPGRSYVVGFDVHTDTGALVCASDERDAIDYAADFYERWHPQAFLEPGIDTDYGEDEILYVGSRRGLAVLADAVWVVEVPMRQVPPARVRTEEYGFSDYDGEPEARRAVRAMRNEGKRRYAEAYLEFLLGRSQEPDSSREATGVGSMATQGARWTIHEAMHGARPGYECPVPGCPTRDEVAGGRP